MTRGKLILLALLITALAGAPETLAQPGANPRARFSWLRTHVFSMCQYCHMSVPGVSFGSHSEAIKLVVPGSPEGSRLYEMVRTRRMPKGGFGLPPEQLQAIHDWIKSGAKDD